MCAVSSGQDFWRGRAFSFFRHENCEYFPCHPTETPGDFNCLFCYCPLYVLGDRCGGEFTWLDNGYKDCSRCLYPHEKERYGEITGRYREILDAMPPSR